MTKKNNKYGTRELDKAFPCQPVPTKEMLAEFKPGAATKEDVDKMLSARHARYQESVKKHETSGHYASTMNPPSKKAQSGKHEMNELDRVLPCRPVPDMSGFVPSIMTNEELDAMLAENHAACAEREKLIESMVGGKFVSTGINPPPKKKK